jgi:glycosyltransferase involved in cell wall biosynthesis
MVAWRQMGMNFSLICVGRADSEHLKSCGFPEEDLYYVPLGSRAAKAASAPRRETSPQNRPNLIFVGSLSIRKRADIAILALAGLRRRYGQDCPVLYIYGDGNEREYLLEIVSTFEMEDVVRFCGFQPNILDRCPDTDILVMSSATETGPMVVLEAMSRGMPIVATDVGDVASMIPEPRYGRRIRPQSIVALTDAIDSLMSDIKHGRFDPNLSVERHRLLFTAEKMTQRTEVVYNTVLAKNSPVSVARAVR